MTQENQILISRVRQKLEYRIKLGPESIQFYTVAKKRSVILVSNHNLVLPLPENQEEEFV